MIATTEKKREESAEKMVDDCIEQLQATTCAIRFLERRGYTVLDKSQSLIVAYDEESNAIVFADVVLGDGYFKKSEMSVEDFERYATEFFESGKGDPFDFTSVRADAIEMKKLGVDKAFIRHVINKSFEE